MRSLYFSLERRESRVAACYREEDGCSCTKLAVHKHELKLHKLLYTLTLEFLAANHPFDLIVRSHGQI